MVSTELSTNSTAQAILDAAESLFMQRGFRSVSIGELVRVAGVTKPTLYYHFADKEEVFIQMSLRMLDRMAVELLALVAEPRPLTEKLERMTTAMLVHSHADVRLMLHDLSEHIGPAGQQRAAAAFQAKMIAPLVELMQLVRAAGFGANRSAIELAWLFLAYVEAFQQRNTLGASPQTPAIPAFAPHQIVELFLYGVRGPENRETV